MTEQTLDQEGVGKLADDLGAGLVGSADESAQTMPLLGGSLGPAALPGLDDAGLESNGGRRIGRGTLLLVLVFAIGIGTLYAMRRSQMDVAVDKDASAAEEKINLALARLAASFGGAAGESGDDLSLVGGVTSTDAIVALFAVDPARQQVPLDGLKKNPFLLVLQREPEPEPEDTGISEEQRRLQALQMAFADLNLSTLIDGQVPLAIVNGQILKAGMTIGPFKVAAIENRTVLLTSAGHEFRLGMMK